MTIQNTHSQISLPAAISIGIGGMIGAGKGKNELLTSIPGIGEKTSATVLAYVEFDRFKSVKELSVFIGVNP